jgi:TolB-like protein/DNA-binding winged helix-turn-helix (wHTH) protein/Tfp pilus assembly protein PilF
MDRSAGARAMIYRFDHFQVDDADFRLTANGTQIPLEPTPFRLLLYLIQNSNRLVRKQEILDTVWQEAAVTDSVLTRSIGLLRKALGDDSRAPRFIETVPTEGYRFIARVSVLEPAPPAAVPVLASALIPETQPVPGPNPQPAVAHLRLRAVALVGSLLLLVAVAGALIEKRLTAERSIHSLAVLPLENLSGDAGQDYFAEGMTDEITTDLARIPDLRVVSRTSVTLARNRDQSLQQIAGDLNVDAVVEGSIVRSGNRIRITAQLIDTRTDKHLWAQSFEGRADDILSLQDSVASQIATQTRFTLLPASGMRQTPAPTVDAAVHDDYLRGRFFFQKQDLPRSAAYFQQAIAADPSYASAYAGLAETLDAESTMGGTDPKEVMPRALAAATRAIQLDSKNGEAYTALGSIQTIYEWNWAAAQLNLTRGLALSPSYPLAEMKYAVYLDAVGRPEDAVSHMRQALTLDPLSFFMNRRLGATLYFARHYDEALKQLARAGEMEPQLHGSLDNYISLAYEAKGMRDEAVAHDLLALRSDRPQVDTSSLESIYRQNGWNAYWTARLEALRTYGDQDCEPYDQAVSYLRLGNRDRAFSSFGRAVDQHCYRVTWMKVDPQLDSIRTDSRYAGLLQRVNLTVQ